MWYMRSWKRTSSCSSEVQQVSMSLSRIWVQYLNSRQADLLLNTPTFTFITHTHTHTHTHLEPSMNETLHYSVKRLRVFVHVCVSLCVHTHSLTCLEPSLTETLHHTVKRLCVCAHVCVCVCVHAQRYTHVHKHRHLTVYLCACISVCVCAFVCLCACAHVCWMLLSTGRFALSASDSR